MANLTEKQMISKAELAFKKHYLEKRPEHKIFAKVHSFHEKQGFQSIIMKVIHAEPKYKWGKKSQTKEIEYWSLFHGQLSTFKAVDESEWNWNSGNYNGWEIGKFISLAEAKKVAETHINSKWYSYVK